MEDQVRYGAGDMHLLIRLNNYIDTQVDGTRYGHIDPTEQEIWIIDPHADRGSSLVPE